MKINITKNGKVFKNGISTVQIILAGYFCARFIFIVSRKIGIHPMKLRSKVKMGSNKVHSLST